MNNSSTLDISNLPGTAEASTLYSNYLTVSYYLMIIRTYGLLPFGLTGSVLTLIVLRQASLPNNGMVQYLTTITVGDTVHLLLMCVLVTMEMLLINSTLSCKLFLFLYLWFTLTSDIVVVTVAIDRVLAIIFPYKSKIWCTPGRAIKKIFVVVFILSFF